MTLILMILLNCTEKKVILFEFIQMYSYYNDSLCLTHVLECDLMFFPSAFHESTGPINWEILPRARACDNQFYVAAINSARDDTAKWVTWGRSMIIDPRGETIVQAGQAEQIVSAVIGLYIFFYKIPVCL